MKLTTVRGVLPVLIIHGSTLWMTDSMRGANYGPVCVVRPSMEGDRSTTEHELEHARQWWPGALLFAAAGALVYEFLFHQSPFLGVLTGLLLAFVARQLAYRLCWRFRYWTEVGAYKRELAIASIREQGALRHRFAATLAHKYRLPVTQQQAYEDLW